jgi:serine/threonine-protein kinase
VTFGSVPLAHAQTAADKATAEALFDEGKRLMEARRYGEACPKLADSQKLDPGVGTLLNLALCYKSNGQTASAWSTYREAASQARAAHADDREELARTEASALEPKLTRMVIEVSPEAANTPGFEVKRDGTSVPAGLWGVPSPVDPGKHVIDITAPGKKPVRIEATAEGAGATNRVVVGPLEDGTSVAPAAPVAAPPPGPAAPPAGAPPESPPDSGSKPGSTQRVIGYVVGGLGIVGLGVGGVFAFGAMSDNDSAEKICPEYPKGDCSKDDVETHKDLVAQAKASGLNSYVAFGLGGAGVIAGAVLILTAPSAPKNTTALALTPVVSPNAWGVDLRGAF